MPKFYFHVRDRNTRYEDPWGINFPDLEDAWQHAHADARSIVRSQLLRGNLNEQWMEIADETGAIIASLPFSRAAMTH